MNMTLSSFNNMAPFITWHIISKNSTLVKAKQIDNIDNDRCTCLTHFYFRFVFNANLVSIDSNTLKCRFHTC